MTVFAATNIDNPQRVKNAAPLQMNLQFLVVASGLPVGDEQNSEGAEFPDPNIHRKLGRCLDASIQACAEHS